MKNILALLFCSILCISCKNENIETKISVWIHVPSILSNTISINQDSVVNKAYQISLKKYDQAQKDFFDIFFSTVDSINKETNLAYLFVRELNQKINMNTTNSELKILVKNWLADEIKKTKQILKTRIEKFIEQSFPQSLTSPKKVEFVDGNIPEKFIIKVTNETETQKIIKIITAHGKLGFWETYDNRDVFQYLNDANKKLTEIKDLPQKPSKNVKKDSLSFLSDEKEIQKSDSTSSMNPLFSVLYPNINAEKELIKGAIVGIANVSDTSYVSKLLNLREVRLCFPRDLKLLWSKKPLSTNDKFIYLFAIKISNRDGFPILDGNVITEVTNIETKSGYFDIEIHMNSEGARLWKRITRENIDKAIAIVVDNQVYSCPFVYSEINSGKSTISNAFSYEESEELITILNGATLPFFIKVLKVEKINN